MAIGKKTTTKKTTTKKKATKKVETKVEETVVPSMPIRYEVAISIRNEPVAKNVQVGTFGFFEGERALKILTGEDSAAGADIEDLFEGDAVIDDAKTGSLRVISRANQPKDWLLSLHKSRRFQDPHPYVASEAVIYTD